MLDGGENIRGVLKEYNIDVFDIKLESYKGKKAVWWIKTSSGYKILKKHSHSPKMLEFIIDATEHFMKNGIKMPEIIKTKNNKNYVIMDETCYVLSEAIEGTTIDYTSPENIRKIVNELGKFHKASKGFIPSKDYKSREHADLWIDKYGAEIEKIKKYYDLEVSNSNHSDFGKIILNEFDHFYDRMKTSLIELDSEEYHNWSIEIKSSGGLCHQDFTAGNLILSNSKDLYVLDTDSLTVDIPIRDIRKILNKIMKRKNGWELELTKDVLRWYQEKNPLTYSQWQVLKSTLIYPHLFVGIMSKYYEKRDKSWTETKYVKRLKEMINMEKSVENIIKNFDTIIPL